MLQHQKSTTDTQIAEHETVQVHSEHWLILYILCYTTLQLNIQNLLSTVLSHEPNVNVAAASCEEEH